MSAVAEAPPTEAKVARALELREQGTSLREIGHELGVAQKTIQRWIAVALRCRHCENRLQRAVADGLCGFCREELVEAPLQTETEQKAAAIIAKVAESRGISIARLRSECRRPVVVRTRYEAAALARRETGASLPELGRILDRDHSTVLAGLRRLEETARGGRG